MKSVGGRGDQNKEQKSKASLFFSADEKRQNDLCTKRLLCCCFTLDAYCLLILLTVFLTFLQRLKRACLFPSDRIGIV